MCKKIEKVCFVILGGGIMGIALDLFLIPCDLAAGGVGGISTVLSHVSGIGTGIWILIINIPIFGLGLLHFDKEFLFYSLLGTLSLSVSTQLFSFLTPITYDMLPAAVFGGALMGMGLSLALKRGGTTGGTDILALILKKKFPHLSVGQFFLLIDGAVIIIAGIVFRRGEVFLYSAAALYITGKVVDAVLEGIDFAKAVYIISDQPDMISNIIYTDMQRGITGFLAKSKYTGKEQQVLMCVIRKYELERLKKAVYRVDSKAFVIISDVKEVLGNGFK